jgi:hypothetical protein
MGSQHNPPKWWLLGGIDEEIAESNRRNEAKWQEDHRWVEEMFEEDRREFRQKFDLDILKSTIPAQEKKINWTCWEYYGAEIKDPDWRNISNERDLFAGQEVIVPSLFGYYKATVDEDSIGKTSVTATGEETVWFLSKSDDGHLPEELRRKAWVCASGANLRAIKKLELK